MKNNFGRGEFSAERVRANACNRKTKVIEKYWHVSIKRSRLNTIYIYNA